VITVEQAEATILSSIGALESETVPLDEALGRVLKESIHSDRDLPPFDRSTMDGIAINSDALQRTLSFPVAGTITAGQVKSSLDDPRSCVEIMTGAPVPQGANHVVKIEDVVISDGVATVIDGAVSFPNTYIHDQGSDAKAGDTLLEAGRRITAKEIAILTSTGKTEVVVAISPRIGIITTGDELISVDQIPKPHQIRRSNDATLAAALISRKYSNVECIHIPDDPNLIQKEIDRLLSEKDTLILTGGISKGKKDFLPDALAEAGAEKLFQWVSQRPGKPFWFGQFERKGTKFPIFALPGNPVSCFTCLHRYVLPALDLWSGLPSPKFNYARLREDMNFSPPLNLFLPVRINSEPTGELWAKPLPFNTSGDFISVAQTDGFIELPKDQNEFNRGDAFRYFPWQT